MKHSRPQCLFKKMSTSCLLWEDKKTMLLITLIKGVYGIIPVGSTIYNLASSQSGISKAQKNPKSSMNSKVNPNAMVRYGPLRSYSDIVAMFAKKCLPTCLPALCG